MATRKTAPKGGGGLRSWVRAVAEGYAVWDTTRLTEDEGGVEVFPKASSWGWPKEAWSFRLVPLLTGQALEAYLAMEEERAGVYAELKEVLLEKFNISPETGPSRFLLVRHQHTYVNAYHGGPRSQPPK
ncbi:hypothetical protein M9458_033322, partial [Cirrhinus mrigala]